jgi:hypothetical protein
MVNLDPVTLRIMELEMEVARLKAILATCTCGGKDGILQHSKTRFLQHSKTGILQHSKTFDDKAVRKRKGWWQHLFSCCMDNGEGRIDPTD